MWSNLVVAVNLPGLTIFPNSGEEPSTIPDWRWVCRKFLVPIKQMGDPVKKYVGVYGDGDSSKFLIKFAFIYLFMSI